jgi:diguanylate cyclase (GGDEF)-like protein/PAS domain S-box-containing protein
MSIMSNNDAASFQFLAENSIDVICRAGPGIILNYVSPSSFHVLGWKPEEMIGRRLDAFITSEDGSALPETDCSGLDIPSVTVRMRKKDGLIAWMDITRRPVCDSATGEAKETVIVMRDVTERKILEERLSALARTDSLTGLSTPRAFDEVLEREWSRTQREGSSISLLLLHFNHFIQFHNWQAHLEGDRCLATAAAAISPILRVTDVAAHYGTEDIAIMLPATGPGGAAKVAEKVRAAIEPLHIAFGHKEEGHDCAMVCIGISTVLARSSGTMRMPEILVLAADNALQRAKRLQPESGGGGASGCSPEDAAGKVKMPSAKSSPGAGPLSGSVRIGEQ